VCPRSAVHARIYYCVASLGDDPKLTVAEEAAGWRACASDHERSGWEAGAPGAAIRFRGVCAVPGGWANEHGAYAWSPSRARPPRFYRFY
jgi:hypothetical protein